MISIYQEICKNLNSGVSLVLVTILNKNEDSLSNFGTQMLVKDDFSIIGSIGGGLMEAMAVKLTKRVFETGEPVVTLLDSSMPWSFAPEVMLEYIDSQDTETLSYFNRVMDYVNNNINFVLLSTFHSSFQGNNIRREILFEQDYCKPGSSLREKLATHGFSKLQFSVFREDESITVVAPLFNRENAYIFGAGYIAQKLSQITSMLNFNTVILDTREEFANKVRFPLADNIIVLKSFNNFSKYINIDGNSYIIIVTRGHTDDTEVLAEVLRSNAKYIGMIGSRKKRNAAYSELIGRGFLPEDLAKVHSPIGININGETPEEITVSIAAELVKVRREK